MRIKICGVTRLDDARAAVEAGADMVGFIFVPGTPRALNHTSALWIREVEDVLTVGVFRNAAAAEIEAMRDALHLDVIQLHGDEPDALLARLGGTIIRRVPVPSGGVDAARVRELHEFGVLPLIDPGAGDGATCNWSDVARNLGGVPFGLAGGLTPDTVAEAVRTCRPALVDVSSGVESSPGIKDHRAVRAFVHSARAAIV